MSSSSRVGEVLYVLPCATCLSFLGICLNVFTYLIESEYPFECLSKHVEVTFYYYSSLYLFYS